MSRIRLRPRLGALLAASLLLAAAGAAAAGYVGRPIVDVLEELRGPGLDFIYSSELLPRSLTVTVEPESGNRLLIAVPVDDSSSAQIRFVSDWRADLAKK